MWIVWEIYVYVCMHVRKKSIVVMKTIEMPIKRRDKSIWRHLHFTVLSWTTFNVNSKNENLNVFLFRMNVTIVCNSFAYPAHFTKKKREKQTTKASNAIVAQFGRYAKFHLYIYFLKNKKLEKNFTIWPY